MLKAKMTLHERAHQDIGLKEIPGSQNNPKIIKFLQALDPRIVEETVSWCSAALNYWAADLGLPQSHALSARSWLTVGSSTKSPTRGNDIVVLWRESSNSWKGHVGVFHSLDNKGNVYILGANQGDEVCIAKFPVTRVLEYRKLK